VSLSKEELAHPIAAEVRAPPEPTDTAARSGTGLRNAAAARIIIIYPEDLIPDGQSVTNHKRLQELRRSGLTRRCRGHVERQCQGGVHRPQRGREKHTAP